MSQTDTATGGTPKTTKPPPSLFKTLDPAALNFRPSESPNNPPRGQVNNDPAGNEFMLAAVSSSLSLPSFWLERPATWFNMCESAFAVRQITSSVTKYHHCVGKLPAETVATVEDVVNNYADFADPYTELKRRLCRAYGKTEMQKVNDLLDLPPLGAEKPSVLMDNILSLWPDATTRETSKLLLGLFLRRLPLQMRSQLANFPATSPAELATAPDAIWSQSGGQVSAAEVTVAAAPGGSASRDCGWAVCEAGAAQRHPCIQRFLFLPCQVWRQGAQV